MDLRFGWRRRGAAVLGAVMVLGLSAAPGGALAADLNAQTSPGQIDARFSGPGFDVHRAIVDNEERIDVNVCSRLIAGDAVHCDARLRVDSRARSQKPARAG